MTYDESPHRVNENIEDRIAAIDDTELSEFLEDVVAHERRNLHLSQPEYTEEYREAAEDAL